jgi:hypothetical protein
MAVGENTKAIHKFFDWKYMTQASAEGLNSLYFT